MTTGVHAELSADGRRIVLAFTGDDYELDAAARALKRLTALTEPTSPPSGMRTAPATWATVTQLAHTFSSDSAGRWLPRPRLREWITQEFLWRHACAADPAALARDVVPPGLTARPYQLEAAAMIGVTGKFLLFDEAGVGKTVSTILGLKARRLTHEVFPLLIVVPSWDVGDVWTRHVRDWAPGWPDPSLYAGPGRSAGADILITSYATLRADAADAAGPLVRLRAAAVVADEVHLCVAHDTLITVPGGVKTISNIKPGDLVRGVDHTTGEPVWTPVRAVMQSPLRETLRLLDTNLRITPEHPVFVRENGSLCYGTDYDTDDIPLQAVREGLHPAVVPVEAGAGSLQRAVRVPTAPREASADVDLRMVREDLCQAGTPRTTSTEVLHHELLGDMADVPAGLRKPRIYPESADRVGSERAQGAQLPGNARLPGVRPEPVHPPVPGVTRESAGDTGRPRVAEPERRERAGAYHPAGHLARAARDGEWLGAGTADPDGHAERLRLPPGLQGGHRAPGEEGCRRGARQGPRPERERRGPEEESPAGIAGLDGAVDLERGDSARSLWNLETGTGNFFADNVLVHNCKNSSSRQSLALRRAAQHAGTFVGLSGTPVTRDTGDVYPVLAAMDPLSWPSRERFVKRYCETSDNGYGERVEGLRALAEPEFRTALAGQYRRVAKADVLPQLPPKTYSLRRVEIPPEWRKAYDAMERDMLAELPANEEGVVQELSVMSVLAQLTRLGQLASSACDVKVTEEPDPVTGDPRKHYEVTLKAPSWKADALLGILAERPGQQVAVFGVSRQLVTIAGAACAQAGYRCGYVVGQQGRKPRAEAISEFQAGRLDVIACTAGAGSLGITLTAAATVVLLQRSWELDKALQPEDRAHRLDETFRHEKIEVIDVVAKDTVDDRVRELLRVKGGHLGQLVQDARIVKELLGGLN